MRLEDFEVITTESFPYLTYQNRRTEIWQIIDLAHTPHPTPRYQKEAIDGRKKNKEDS